MSVFTPLSFEQVQSLLDHYLFQLASMEPAHNGIENSNFLLEGYNASGEADAWVLTLFEQLDRTCLPWFIDLLAQSQRAGLPVAAALPMRSTNSTGRRDMGLVSGKPFILVPRLPGHHPEQPVAGQCEQIGDFLCKFHQIKTCPAPRQQPDEHQRIRSLAGRLQQLPGDLQNPAQQVLTQWLAVSQSHCHQHVLIHGDLFRDNALFCEGQLSGVLDFYNACHDLAVYDLAVCLNDWCCLPDGNLNTVTGQALVHAYLARSGFNRDRCEEVRRFLPLALQMVALRFYLSRLPAENPQTTHSQAQGQVTKDPTVFEQIFRRRLESPSTNLAEQLAFPDLGCE